MKRHIVFITTTVSDKRERIDDAQKWDVDYEKGHLWIQKVLPTGMTTTRYFRLTNIVEYEVREQNDDE